MADFTDVLGGFLDEIGNAVRDELVSLPFPKRYEHFVDAMEQLCKVHDVRLATVYSGGLRVYDGARANHTVDELLDADEPTELGHLMSAGYKGKDEEA